MNVGPRHILIRAFLIWLVIIAVESAHGVLRTIYLAPAIGDHQARQVSVFTGAILILLIAGLFAWYLKARSTTHLIGIGAFWTVLTVIFEIVLGRFAMGLSWERIRAEYDVTSGSLMPLGLVFMVFAPLIAEKARKRVLK
jgi:hypothetical protein